MIQFSKQLFELSKKRLSSYSLCLDSVKQELKMLSELFLCKVFLKQQIKLYLKNLLPYHTNKINTVFFQTSECIYQKRN